MCKIPLVAAEPLKRARACLPLALMAASAWGCAQDPGQAAPPDADVAPAPDAGQDDSDAQSAGCEGPWQTGCDCDPSGQIAAHDVYADPLTADEGQAEVLPGFDAGAWEFAGDGYRQEAEIEPDRDDASVFPAASASDVLAEISAAATEVEGLGDDLRQVFLTARATGDEEHYEAVGCGIELSQNGGLERIVSIVELSGSPGAVQTDRIASREYDGVDLDELFHVRMELRDDRMTCRVTTEDEAVFVQADGFGGGAGAVGVHARENHVLFRDLHVCGLP